jgi:hypothetical protein
MIMGRFVITIKRSRLIFWIAALFLIAGCGGGFGTDSGNADEFGPAIFGSDTAKNILSQIAP